MTKKKQNEEPAQEVLGLEELETVDGIYSKTETRNMKYTFNNEEKLQIAEMLSNQVQDKSSLLDEKKSIVSDYSSKINILDEKISLNSDKIARGYEFREVNCRVELHTPIEGFKTITRLDTNESWEEKMIQLDYDLFTQFKADQNEKENVKEPVETEAF